MSQISLTNQRLCNDICVTDGETKLVGTCLKLGDKLTELETTIFRNEAYAGSVNYRAEDGTASLTLNVSDSTAFMDMLSLVQSIINELENPEAGTE